MARTKDVNEVQHIVDTLAKNRKQFRQVINQIALYSQGSYTVQDMYNMTMPMIEEIRDEIMDKSRLEKERLEQARGTNLKTY